MDKKEYTKDTVFSRLTPVSAKCEYSKPLSVYSTIMTRDQKDSLHQFCNPFINFKIEIMNNCVKKRKIDHSSGGYETPAKKAYSPKVLSPDLGCFMDYSSPSISQDSVSPVAISKPALLEKTQTVRSEIKQNMSSQLHLEHVESGSSTEPGDNEGAVPHSLRCEKVLNVAPAFDGDVDSILCLNPIGTSPTGGFSDNVESSKSPSSNTSQNKPSLISAVADRQKMERGDRQAEKEREGLKKEIYQSVKNVEEDKGYSSLSYVRELKTGQDPFQSPHPYLPLATSSPLLRSGEVQAPEKECHPESSSEPGCHKQTTRSGQHLSFTVSDQCPVVSGPLFESGDSPLEPLEGDIEKEWDIGLPLFESSVCHNVTVKLNASSEQSRQVSAEGQEDLIDPIHECQATLDGDAATLDTSYEITLPLQVQVKSVVVAPSHNPFCSKPAAAPLPKQNVKPAIQKSKENRDTQPARCASSARSQRPVIFDGEVDFDRAKQRYLHSVTRHLNENPAKGQDAMTELFNLMTHVADQTPGGQWQHPSDLTCRNYQRRFGNMMPKMALHEWQALNSPTHKRFAQVPKIFQRSQFS